MATRSYHLDVLRSHQVDRAFLLVHAVVPRLTLIDWRQSVSSVFRRYEIVTATNPSGTVQGLCIYRIRQHEAAGRLLDIPFLVATSAGDPEGVAAVLLDHLKVRAKLDRCRSIRVWTLDADNWRRMQDPAFFERWDHGLMMKV
jgi:hypothetical protein